MENTNEVVPQYFMQRVKRMATAEHWYVQDNETLEVVGEAMVMFDEDFCHHIMLTLDAEHVDNSDLVLDTLLDTLGLDDYSCTVSEMREEVYSDDDLDDDECDCGCGCDHDHEEETK